MTTDQITDHIINPDNWQPLNRFAKSYPQFTESQLKRLFWKREEHKGLSTCYRQVGKRGYINSKLFGLWLAGQLPEQRNG